MPEIMTTKEVAKYLRLHEVTIWKYAAEDKIPATRIGSVWRFDKEVIDKWITEGQKEPLRAKKSKAKATRAVGKRKLPKKRKN